MNNEQFPFIQKINENIVNPLITLLFAVAVVYFLYGLLKFLQNQDNEEAQAAGKQHMIWGVVGIFLMLSVWGILSVIQSTVEGLFG